MKRKHIVLLTVIAVAVAACLIFPSVLGFVEVAARDLRYLWWLILIAAIGVYLLFFAKKR